MDKSLKKVFSKMLSNRKVEITKEYREALGVDYLGRWFYVESVDRHGNVTLISVKGSIPLDGVNYKNLIV